MPAPVRYQYILSLPERVVRSLGALSGGLLREIGNAALPARLRRTTLYRTMVEVTLRFLIEEVGQVEGVFPTEQTLAGNFLLKRTASHGIELLGIFAFHASPVWVLAALADATGGGKKIIADIAQALKEEGLIEGDARLETVEQMLDGLEATSQHLAVTLNLPPVDTASLRREWLRLKDELRSIPPKRIPAAESIQAVWDRLRREAAREGRPVFMVSSLMAVAALRRVPANALWLSKAARSAARRTGKLFGETILDHYVETLAEIRRAGFTDYWGQEFRPYLRGAAEQFTPGRQSATERLLSRS